MKLVKSIVFRSRLNEDMPAIAFPGGIATYGALMKAVGAAADAIRIFELAPGTPVLLDIRNPIHHTAMVFALALLGLPSASVGTASVAETAGFLPNLFFTDRPDVKSAGIRQIQVDERWFATDPAARPDYTRLLALPGFPSGDSIVRLVYSSGTTGMPKCVGLTADNLERRLFNSHVTFPQRLRGPAVLNMMGLSTISGTTTLFAAHFGGNLACYAGSAAEALRLVRLFHVSLLMASVSQLRQLVEAEGDQAPPPSLDAVVVLGSKLSPSLLDETRLRLCNTVLFGYGSTELNMATLGTSTGTEMPEGFAGHVLPWVSIEATDDDGNPLPPGQPGRLRVRSEEMAFYLRPDGSREELGADGWFHPGDIGRVDSAGRLVVTGRSGDVLNRGGVVVAPELIEDVLRTDPQVRDVAVVGVAGAHGIEEIWAAVVSDGLVDAQRLVAAARGRLNEKVPDRVVQVSIIPRNDMGKIKRSELREQLLARVRS